MWQLILVDYSGDVRNGGLCKCEDGDVAVNEAWYRAKVMQANYGVRIKSVVCQCLSSERNLQ